MHSRITEPYLEDADIVLLHQDFRQLLSIVLKSGLLNRLLVALLAIGAAGIAWAEAPPTQVPPEGLWSLRPVKTVRPPEVSNAAWSSNPIDRFVFDRLNRAGLEPAGSANRATLIRRATFDLTGLPPTAREIHDFESDTSPNAWEKVVDRLLDSPHYGERWGRHWLDIARYVPGRISFPGVKHTSGDQAYRDYVVCAFNTDKPYNQFVVEQLAGDLLPAAPDQQKQFDQIIAPAFLSIGSWFDQCTDPNRLRMEIIDDMIGTTAQGFLGLSAQCARCHDHKFDPIPTADYYAMAGIFGSTRVLDQLNNYWRDGRPRLLKPLAMPEDVAASERLARQISQLRQSQWEILSTARARLAAEYKAQEADYAAAAAEVPRSYLRTFKAEEFDGEHNLRVAQLSHDGVATNILESLTPSDQWVKYKFDMAGEGRFALDALYCTDEPAPLVVQVNGTTVSTNALSESTGGWDLKYERWGEVAAFDLRKGLNFLRIDAKEGMFPRLDRLRLRRVSAQGSDAIAQAAAKHHLNPLLLTFMLRDPTEPLPSEPGMTPFLTPDENASTAKLEEQIAQLEKSRKSSDLVISVQDEPKPDDMPVHVRGDVYAVSNQPVSRGVPRLLDGVLPRPAIPASQSGRLQLAQWIVDPRNPLTCRVIVNRIWQWHFGRGIVASTSDFGTRGDPPSHPELLDYLAAKFVESGWSIKRMHRLILTSRTYQLSTEPDAASAGQLAKLDPDNRLLAHFRRRRLDAEELYDSMLSSANLMIRQAEGQPLNVEKSKNRAMYVLASNRAPKGLGPDIRKMFPLFDYDPSGAPIAVRPTSTTAAQSLFWLNSPLASYYAGRFSERLLKMDKLSDRKRVEMAYLLAVGHDPPAGLGDASLEFVQCQVEAGLPAADAWAQLCQAIFASDEFHYVN